MIAAASGGVCPAATARPRQRPRPRLDGAGRHASSAPGRPAGKPRRKTGGSMAGAAVASASANTAPAQTRRPPGLKWPVNRPILRHPSGTRTRFGPQNRRRPSAAVDSRTPSHGSAHRRRPPTAEYPQLRPFPQVKAGLLQSAEGVGFEPTRRVVTRPTIFQTVSGTGPDQRFHPIRSRPGAPLRHGDHTPRKTPDGADGQPRWSIRRRARKRDVPAGQSRSRRSGPPAPGPRRPHEDGPPGLHGPPPERLSPPS